MATPWFVTSWKYNFKGSISSKKGIKRCETVLYVYFVCLLLGCLIAWAIVENEIMKIVLLLLIALLSVLLSLTSVVYLTYFASRWCYLLYYRCIRKQRKSMLKNHMNLRDTLIAFREQVPTMDQLKRIEERSRNYLCNVQTLINERLNIDTEILLTGSAAERYGVPFTSLQKNEETSNDCPSKFAFCCQESLQEAELGTLHDLKHAILTDCDCMISPKNRMVSFNDGINEQMYQTEQRQMYQATVKEFPFYIISYNSDAHFSSKDLKKELLHAVEKLDVTSFPWDFSGGEHSNNFVELYINGPALTLKLGSTESRFQITDMAFYGDITYSLKCPEWPDICNWGRRPPTLGSNQPNLEKPIMKWPQPEEVERIKSFGCHFVPKSHPEDSDGLTWRISFSRAEIELSKLVPETARLCLIGLKVIAKDYLSVACKKFKSYHLKCIFLYTLEFTEPSIWEEENVEYCFHVLLKSLRTCLETEMVPYFWVSTENLLKDFTKKDFEKLLEQLTRVENDPSKFIELLLHGNPIEYQEETDILIENEPEQGEFEPAGQNDYEISVLIQ